MAQTVTPAFRCALCQEEFPSRNTLFDHLSSSGHHTGTPSRGVVVPTFVRDNSDFFTYYAEQGVAGSARAWEECYARFKEHLKVCFRVSAGGSPMSLPVTCAVVLEFLQRCGVSCEPAAYHNADSNPLCLLYTCPDSTAGLSVLTDLGLIQRQEQNSALPPLLLDVCGGDFVLDMCAAPGSKTLQLMDLMISEPSPIEWFKMGSCGGVYKRCCDGAGAKEPGLPRDPSVTKPPEVAVDGLLVANDSDRTRISLVAKRARLQPRHSLLVTCSDAKVCPTLRRRRGFKMRFTRVLCDVPCSSDGTLRKDRTMRSNRCSIWSTWSVRDGLGLHGQQLRILRRGLEHLCPGGRLLYSTCSLNPIEDEAVVAGILELLPAGSVSLVALPCIKGLSYTPGLQSWRVPDPRFSSEQPAWIASYEDAQNGDKATKRRIVRTMFPPTRPDVIDQLARCARVLPIHGDGGGFFVALFEKGASKGTQQADSDMVGSMPNKDGLAEKPELASVEHPSTPRGSASLGLGRTSCPVPRPLGAYAATALDELSSAILLRQKIAEGSAHGLKAESDMQQAKPTDVHPFANLHPLFKESELNLDGSPALESTVLTLETEFNLGMLARKGKPGSTTPGSGTACGATEDGLLASMLVVRGDNLLVASSAMTRIWCTPKSLQVVEAGHYLFSAVSRPFREWSIYPEAAAVLGRYAANRRINLSLDSLGKLLDAYDAGVGVRQAELSIGISHGEAPWSEGPFIFGIELPPSMEKVVVPRSDADQTLSSCQATIMGYLAGAISADGLLSIVGGSVITARQWHVVLEKLS